MLNMQTFHQSLATQAADPRRRQLTRLTQVRREQILALTSELTWYIWNEEAEPEAAQ